MVFKVNYNQQRNERDRAKQAKKDAKLREKEAEVARRRNTRDESPNPENPVQEDEHNGPT